MMKEQQHHHTIPLSQIDFAKKAVARFTTAQPESEDLEGLITSIKRSGVLQPIIVRPKGKGKDKYEVVAGNRRVRAAKIAKLQTIPAIIRDLTDTKARRIAFMENIHRKDLGAIEKAKGIAAIYKDAGLTKSQAIQYVKSCYNKDSDRYSKESISRYSFKETQEVKDAFVEIGLNGNQQYQYLQLITQLSEKVQELAEEVKLSSKKASLLTHTALREHPGVQKSLAYEMVKKYKDDKPKSETQCRHMVQQTVHDLSVGALQKREGGGYGINYYTREDVNKVQQLEEPFHFKMMDLNHDVITLIGKLLNRPLNSGEIEYKEEVYKPKIEELKKNLQTVRHQDRLWFANNTAILMLVCKAVVESAK